MMFRQQEVLLYDMATGKQLRQLEGQRHGPFGVRFSPDGKTLTALTNEAAGNPVWELATSKVRQRIKGPQSHPSQEIASPDGALVAAAHADSIFLWEAATGKELGRLEGRQGAILSLAFAPDGASLVSAGSDTTALVWDLRGLARPKRASAELTPEQLTELWSVLTGDDAAKAYRAMSALSASADAVPFLKDRLKPVPEPDPAALARWIAHLDSPSFPLRNRAAGELERLGDLAAPALQQLLAGRPALEVRQRVERLLDKLAPGQTPAPETLRALRVVEILEQLGTPEADRMLKALANGAAGARLTNEAEAALGRLGWLILIKPAPEAMPTGCWCQAPAVRP
jgi:hypothetical protein